jgi:hypothetical protein
LIRRASAVVSTSAPTMIRSPPERTISIRPFGSGVTTMARWSGWPDQPPPT